LRNTNDLILGKSTSPHHSSPFDKQTSQWHELLGAGHYLWELNPASRQEILMAIKDLQDRYARIRAAITK
jgi:hypothetical protein